ncbi:DUF7859 family protein [Halocatena salina]|nr:hypothetical protein [Halocatena salina]
MAFDLNDPLLIVVLAVVVLFLFALYLLFRRTALAFQEGMDGKNR